MIDTLGGEEIAGAALLSLTWTRYAGATNETCFSAHPEYNFNAWGSQGGYCHFWTSTESDYFDEDFYWEIFRSYILHIDCETSETSIYPKPKPYLYQVRCIKDQKAP